MALVKAQLVKKPRRWDRPFAGGRLGDVVVDRILSQPIFRVCEHTLFPDTTPLHEIVANDCRLLRLAPGGSVYDRHCFGSSIFVILEGSLVDEKGCAYSQFDAVGEIETLRRCARASAMAAGGEGALVLEMRWAGLRELLHWSDAFNAHFMQLYATRALQAGLYELCSALAEDMGDFSRISRSARLVRLGEFDWSHRFQRANRSRSQARPAISASDILTEEGAYLDEFYFVCSGFLQSTCRKGAGALINGCLGAGDFFGIAELRDALRCGVQARSQVTLAAMGYADVIAVPAAMVSEVQLDHVCAPACDEPGRIDELQSTRDFLIDERFVNGRQAMVIDLSRCVHCDECLRACSETHGGVARFARTGKTHDGTLVANACMHCTDAVCLVDCPTGAIHRTGNRGSVVVDETACIGCGACAAGCPYDNIQMVPARNGPGAPLIDDTGAAILKAVKCDLCEGRAGGPACQEACASQALLRVCLQDMCADTDLWSLGT